jgi:DNA repair protein RecO (recombination protein O)
MPPYKEQGIVLRSVKLGEADKIVTILTQGSGKVRAVAKGLRKTTSRFGGRLEPFTHVNLMLYRGRGALDTVTQVEIMAAHRRIRDDLTLFAAAETMVEAVDKVAEEHERNVPLVVLLLHGLRALDAGPTDPASVAESFWLKLLSLSGFHPALTACAVCGSRCSPRSPAPTCRSSVAAIRPTHGGRPRRAACLSASPSTTWSAGCARFRCS